jgi:thiol-disulfide isomerase/thioredoxin
VDTWVGAESAAVLVAVGMGILGLAAVAYAAQLRVEARRLNRDLHIARQSATVASRWGLPAGLPAPSFELEGLYGGTVSLESLLMRNRPILLLFISPWCGPCHAMLPRVQHWQETLSERLTIAILTMGSPEQNNDLAELDLDNVLLQDDTILEIYQVVGTPTAILVSADGRIASNKAEQESAIEPLLRLALRARGAPSMEGTAA